MKKSFGDLSFFFKSSIMISGIFPIAYSVGGFIHKNYYGKKISFYHSSDIHSAACIPFFKFPIHIYCICHNIINIIMHNNDKRHCFFTSNKIKDAAKCNELKDFIPDNKMFFSILSISNTLSEIYFLSSLIYLYFKK